ncbi:MAG: methylmalonyl Co-A mutase-associated GTPase MeaB [Akkermansiaceae bacterium]|nr:methylmalonyl Co-A mutase-associated GTPase MeaB [Akkermansiaceae bacterium]
MTASPSRFDPEALAEGVLAGSPALLGRAITLIESNAARDQEPARRLVSRLLPHSGNSVRIGITGVPGVGKSSFIEAFGSRLCEKGLRVAVLAIDPSSTLSKGSVMGDKTRMEKLSGHENAFVRPSPSGGTLGGVARKSRETMIACEAAGYDVLLIETVGVGQSETTVRSMVDVFLLLLITGAGDDLQGIKRGIMELADLLVVTKDDGDNHRRALAHRQELRMVLHYLQSPTPGWKPEVLTCSSLEGTGLDEIERRIDAFRVQQQGNGHWFRRRRAQSLDWVRSLVHEALISSFESHPDVASHLPELEQSVGAGRLDPVSAARRILDCFTYPFVGR